MLIADGPDVAAPRPDPVAAHVAELERSLRGPARLRRGMLREVRDGLDDARTAYRAAGLDPRRAAELAVRDFGPVAGLAPLYQGELAAAQGRRTALLLVVAFPALLVGWDLVWASGLGWGRAAPPVVRSLAVVLDLASGLVAATALGLLLLGLRRAVDPRRICAATGLVALGAVLASGGTAVAMAVANAGGAWAELVVRPGMGVAYLVSALALAVVGRTAVHTLRASQEVSG